MSVDTDIDHLTEEQIVRLAARTLAWVRSRYATEPALVERFGDAAADDVRLALENACEGLDRFLDHFHEAPPSRLRPGARRRGQRCDGGLGTHG